MRCIGQKALHLGNPIAKKKSVVRRPLKYNNTISYIDGKCMRSKKEAKFYSECVVRKKAKDIKDFEFQVKFKLPPDILTEEKQIKSINYILDFIIINNDGSKEYVDVKGFITPVYRIKKMLMKFFYDIDIKEI